MVWVEQGLSLQQDAGDPEQPAGDPAQGATVGMAPCPQRVVPAAAFRVILDWHAGSMEHGLA